MSNQTKLNRRGLISGLSIAGVGSLLLGYQNCSQVAFEGYTPAVSGNNNLSSTGDSVTGGAPTAGTGTGAGTGAGTTTQTCSRALSIFDCPTRIPASFPPTSSAGAALDHNPNAVFYKVPYFDHTTKAEKAAYLLTVDVGSNPSTEQYHMVGSNDSTNVNIVTDIYVLNESGATLYWKRFGGSDHKASAMFVLDPTLVAGKGKLKVAVRCLEHGYFYQNVDLNQTPLDYSTAVAKFDSSKAFGGCNIERPYVSVDATGGQGNISNVHSPEFGTVTNNEVKVTLGSATSKHGAAADNHYVAGGLLLDQNSNLLALTNLSYAMSKDHQLIFNGLDLAARKVSTLRVVVMDTFNGYLQGFYKVS